MRDARTRALSRAQARVRSRSPRPRGRRLEPPLRRDGGSRIGLLGCHVRASPSPPLAQTPRSAHHRLHRARCSLSERKGHARALHTHTHWSLSLLRCSLSVDFLSTGPFSSLISHLSSLISCLSLLVSHLLLASVPSEDRGGLGSCGGSLPLGAFLAGIEDDASRRTLGSDSMSSRWLGGLGGSLVLLAWAWLAWA